MAARRRAAACPERRAGRRRLLRVTIIARLRSRFKPARRRTVSKADSLILTEIAGLEELQVLFDDLGEEDPDLSNHC